MGSSALFLVTLATIFSLASASTFQVGGSDGWTSSKNVNYTKWSDSIHFQVGDFLRFVYDNKTENVLRVSQHHYAACNVTEPVKKWTSGNDSFHLHRGGHFFFISSVDGKCQGKAKVNVKAYENDEDKAPSPSASAGSVVHAPAPKAAAAATVTVNASSIWSLIVALLIMISV
ncbi:unnamed protein product [Rhodiola kirilowii]